MKRKILQTIIVALLFIVATISCKKDEPLNNIALDKTLTVFAGETVSLAVTFIPENATNKKLNWESSAPNIATVENGKVTGVARGEAKITATSQDGGRTATCIVYVIQPIEPEMVWVEGGTFTMGCTDEQGEDCFDFEKPNHKVTVSGFSIGKYQVTQKEWVAAMGTNPSYSKGDDTPVHFLTWNEVQEYITVLNAYTGKKYRLPTEAEWEYAARGGNQSKGYKYSGSNFFDEVAWHDGNSSDKPHPVGEKKPNELGIFDMSGNLWEHCSDCSGNYTADSQTNPTGPTTGDYRIIRGGAWYTAPTYIRVSTRSATRQNDKLFGGFRLVLPAE